MKKRGVSKLILISSIALIIILAGLTYYYITKEKVVLTPEEQKPLPEEQQTVKPEQKTLELTQEELEKAKAIGLTQEEAKTSKSLDLTLEEFKEVSTKAEEYFKEVAPFYDQSALDYSKVDNIKKIERDKSLDLELKPDSKVVIVQYTWSSPSPYIIYLIENGDIKVLVQESYPEGELS